VGDTSERIVHGLRIHIDPTVCVGFADCIGVAPTAFTLGHDGVVTFTEPERVDRAVLIEACDVCPVDALTVWNETGAQIVP
jgi:ferredoxin